MVGRPKLTEHETVIAVAEKLGATPAQVLVAWGVYRGYSVIPKSVQEGTSPLCIISILVSFSFSCVRIVCVLLFSFCFISHRGLGPGADEARAEQSASCRTSSR